MYHTSHNLITEGMINDFGVAGDCLFFSEEIKYWTGSPKYYVYEADFNCELVSELYDEEIVSEIAERICFCEADFNCDLSSYLYDEEMAIEIPERSCCCLDLAESLLNSREHLCNQNFKYDRNLYLWLQGKKGECAVKMGFDGCKEVDSPITVYIIPMKGRESELKLVKVVDLRKQ